MQANLTSLNRLAYSFPPDHGARLVSTVLQSPDLRADWLAEVEGIRQGMISVREALAQALRAECRTDRFGFVAEHRGMFSRLGLTVPQVDTLRERYGIYMLGDSRMNVAGLTTATVPVLARAIAEVTA